MWPSEEDSKEVQQLREAALLERARLKEAELQSEKWVEQSRKLQTEAEAHQQEVAQLKQDRQRNQEAINRCVRVWERTKSHVGTLLSCNHNSTKINACVCFQTPARAECHPAAAVWEPQPGPLSSVWAAGTPQTMWGCYQHTPRWDVSLAFQRVQVFKGTVHPQIHRMCNLSRTVKWGVSCVTVCKCFWAGRISDGAQLDGSTATFDPRELHLQLEQQLSGHPPSRRQLFSGQYLRVTQTLL